MVIIEERNYPQAEKVGQLLVQRLNPAEQATLLMLGIVEAFEDENTEPQTRARLKGIICEAALVMEGDNA